MRSSILTALFALALGTTSSPTPHKRAYGQSTPTNFLLVTTISQTSSLNSSSLASVSATSLFDPYNEAVYLLREIGPGYGSLPRFNLTSSGDLQTVAEGPEATGPFVYTSVNFQAGMMLGFTAESNAAGKLGFQDGYLLTVGGVAEGWAICPGQLEQRVLSWKSNATSCEPTYVQAVQTAPY